VSKNNGLAAQFSIESIPSLFLYRGNKVYRYEGPLIVDSIVEWCVTGYKQQAAIPYMQSPMGIVGQAKGAVLSMTTKLYNVIPDLAKRYNISPFLSVMLIVFGLAGGILIFTCMFVFVSVSDHAKND
jgi:hypothetical protein